MATVATNGALLLIFIALIEGILTTVCGWLVDSANNIVAGLLNSNITNFKTSGNLLTIFENLFNTYNLKIGSNIAQIVLGMSFVLIITFMLFEVINSYISSLQGEAAENPIKILARGILTLVLEFLIFGIPNGKIATVNGKNVTTTGSTGITCTLNGKGGTSYSLFDCYNTKELDEEGNPTVYQLNVPHTKVEEIITSTESKYWESDEKAQQQSVFFNTERGASLLSIFGEMMAKCLNWVFGDGIAFSAKGLSTWLSSFDIAGVIVVLILQIAIFKNVIQCAIVFIERYLSFAFYILMGPLAVACNATSKTKTTFHDWLIGILSQFLTIFVSVIALRMYVACWGKFIAGVGNGNGKFDLLADFGVSPTIILHYCVCLGLLALVTNSEKIVNALGFRTIMNGDTMRSWGAGAMAVGAAWRMTGGRALAKATMAAGGNLMHKQSVAARNTYGEDSRTARVFNALDPHKNTQVGMNGNQFAKSNYSLNKQTGQMEYNNPNPIFGKTSSDAMVKQNLNAINGALRGDNAGVVKMEDIMDATKLNSVTNFGDISKYGQVFRDKDNNAIISFKASTTDQNGQIHTDTFGISLNGDLERGTKLTATNDLDSGVYSKQIGTSYANTGNGMTLYKLDNTKTLSNSDFKAEVEAGNIDGQFVKDGKEEIFYTGDGNYAYTNAQDYNELMTLAQNRNEAVYGNNSKEFLTSYMQAQNKANEAGIKKLETLFGKDAAKQEEEAQKKEL